MRPSLWWSAGVVMATARDITEGTNTKKRGRPRKAHDDQALHNWESGSNAMLLESKPAYSMDKGVYTCDCMHAKHRMFVSVRVANKRPACVCHVCRVLGTDVKSSKYERLVYTLCDAEELIEAFAVEACAVSEVGEVEVCDGSTACVSKKRWDVMVLTPANLLIEVQGQGHSTKLVTMPNSSDSSMEARHHRDEIYAEAAVRAGCCVLWLEVGSTDTPLRVLRKAWAAELKHAVAYVRDNHPPKLMRTSRTL